MATERVSTCCHSRMVDGFCACCDGRNDGARLSATRMDRISEVAALAQAALTEYTAYNGDYPKQPTEDQRLAMQRMFRTYLTDLIT